MTKRQHWVLLKLLPYVLISFLSAIVYWLLEIGLLGDNATYPYTNNIYNPGYSLIAVTSMAVLLGAVLGTIEETFFKAKFQSRSFFLKITLKTLIYISLLIFLLFVQSLILTAINMNKSVFDAMPVNTVLVFFTNLTFLGVVVYISSMVGLGLLTSEIIDFLGIDVVSSFFTGKYNKSVIEERIFMFLDMKGSTTIAEQLGHEKHYEFINEYYGDMTNAIIETKGRIYQYVGDEIIISWNLEDGLKNANCINCFFLIKKALQIKKNTYEEKYGVSPAFKAALHYGKVTRGQVGLIKKELLFTGDVLNTTARIQSLCKELNADFLVSDTLRKLLPNSEFDFNNKGAFSLRGRKKEEILLEILPK